MKTEITVPITVQGVKDAFDQLYEEWGDKIIEIVKTEKYTDPQWPLIIRYYKELLVLNKGELKHIIDYIIKTLSDDQIKQIREPEKTKYTIDFI